MKMSKKFLKKLHKERLKNKTKAKRKVKFHPNLKLRKKGIVISFVYYESNMVNMIYNTH